ncbi:MAG: integrase domain-containing protein [Pseudodesulfovibrio sp.]|nr:integrase domain-containing protein [Pseudodesulfovibrio sp.]
MKKDRLMTGFQRAKLPGSFKTKTNDRQGIMRFVGTLRNEGCNIQKWTNVHRGHLANVVERWQSEGLTSGTMKNYLASVRKLCGHYGNSKIVDTTNAQLGIKNRVYVTNEDKSIPDEVYNQAVRQLAGGNRNQQAVGLIMEVARTYGTRLEESYKLWPAKDIGPNALVTISRGTKGGRERTFEINDRQQNLAEKVKVFSGKKGNLIPDGWSEKSWRQYVYTEARAVGIGQASCGASFHGFRHARMHELYEEICGVKPRVKYTSTSDFINAAQSASGADWQQLDGHASRMVTLQAGHGVDRYVYTQYLGSWRS